MTLTKNTNTLISKGLTQLQYWGGFYDRYKRYTRWSRFDPGHFYSPLVNLEEIKAREQEIWADVDKNEIEGIDLQEQAQLELFGQLSKHFSEIPFGLEKKDGHRYGLDNEFYPFIDGLFLYSMIRHVQPRRIIEMGSGYSSALMLDVNDLFFNRSIQLTFIEPNPERLYSLITEADKNSVTIYDKMVQQVDLDLFKTLERGDILFIDSSHVSKTGSDVNYLLFKVLPLLKPGVLIHFHDIFYPFEYVKSWVYEGRCWTENYILRAFLMYNQQYRIRLFAHYLHTHHAQLFQQVQFPFRYDGVNLWIEKMEA